MAIYARHMAWLNATPKPDERSRRGKRGANGAKLLSRRETLKRQGIKSPPMPPLPAPLLLAHFIEIGVSEAAGMGVGPVSWREIDAWRNRSGLPRCPWEDRILRKMSVEYVAEGRRAEHEACPPPWRGDVTEEERKAERDLLDDILG